MRILLYTVLNCISCDKHRKSVVRFCEENNVKLFVYNLDDPAMIHIGIAAMKKFKVDKTPSIVVLDDEGNMSYKIVGIQRSLERLNQIIDETNRS
jgi:tartrate dehydratase beta subunit/fumarate hydratase class I family protein